MVKSLDRGIGLTYFGLTPVERSIVKSVSNLSQRRDISYYVVEEGELESARIIMVDADSQEAMAEWEVFRTAHPAKPSVLVSRAGTADHHGLVFPLKRVGLGARLLKQLDQVALTALNYKPELSIGSDKIAVDRSEQSLPAAASVAAPRSDIAAPGISGAVPVSSFTTPDPAPVSSFGTPSVEGGASPASSFASPGLEADTSVSAFASPDATSTSPSEFSLETPASLELAQPSHDGFKAESAVSAFGATPDVPGAEPVIAPPPPPPVVEAPPKPPMPQALVVDDSLSVRTQMKLCLQMYDVEVDFAEDAETALEKVKNNRYDIMFLDVVLPEMDGYKACKLVKGNKATRKLPVVMLTSKSSPFNKVRGAMSGCDRYLTKPVDAKDIHTVLKKFVPAIV